MTRMPMRVATAVAPPAWRLIQVRLIQVRLIQVRLIQMVAATA
jgi:hypothetical protein